MKIPTPRRKSHYEDSLQEAIVTFHRRAVAEEDAVLFAIPNGGRRNPREGARLKRMGVLAGAADLVLLTMGKTDLIEIKLKKGLLIDRDTSQSDSQEVFEAMVTRLGHPYTIVRSIEDYVKILDERGVRIRFRPIGTSPALEASPPRTRTPG